MYLQKNEPLYKVYRIYYGNEIVYVGRTKSLLSRRMYCHMQARENRGDRKIDIEKFSKVEYIDLRTESDMNFAEVYFINKFKCKLNKHDKGRGKFTFACPELDEKNWKEYSLPNVEIWRDRIHNEKLDLEALEISNLNEFGECFLSYKGVATLFNIECSQEM